MNRISLLLSGSNLKLDDYNILIVQLLNLTNLMKNNRFLARNIHCYWLNKILLSMKLIFVLLFAFIFQARADSYAQSVSLSYKNVSAEIVFREIKRQTGYNILCDVQFLDELGKVDANFKKTKVKT